MKHNYLVVHHGRSIIGTLIFIATMLVYTSEFVYSESYYLIYHNLTIPGFTKIEVDVVHMQERKGISIICHNIENSVIHVQIRTSEYSPVSCPARPELCTPRSTSSS